MLFQAVSDLFLPRLTPKDTGCKATSFLAMDDKLRVMNFLSGLVENGCLLQTGIFAKSDFPGYLIISVCQSMIVYCFYNDTENSLGIRGFARRRTINYGHPLSDLGKIKLYLPCLGHVDYESAIKLNLSGSTIFNNLCYKIEFFQQNYPLAFDRS